MIFERKNDGRRKVRLITDGHMVALHGMSAISSVVKDVSVRLLDIIAHHHKLSVMCGDIGNAFITTPCLVKIYTVVSGEFGQR